MRSRKSLVGTVVLSLLACLFLTGPAHAATGFAVRDGRLHDANGVEFVLRGVNHAHTWYPQRFGSLAHLSALGANSARVVLSTGDRWARNDAADVARVVAECRRQRLICVLEVHDTTGLGDQAGAITLDRAADYWLGIREALRGQESFVIINIGNEPHGNSGHERWSADTRGAIGKLRAAGLRHTLMVDAPNWGQDWSATMRDGAGAVFAADPLRNTVFSVHMYGVYNTAAKVSDYLGRFLSARLPIVVGEFGHLHSDGDPDENAILAFGQANRIGYLGWSWSGNSAEVGYLDMSTGFDPAQLTGWGQRIFHGPNGIRQTAKRATVFGGAA
ncbi:mannan endo-1,4-beta-mannosidase [Crossiella equi]|uniref:cellulase n=1 Tax=Crossiella equi TaxID=130796 RepID=A0ABS5ASR2_9PSEU|nr:glycoside hydrolase family 5 protein [Crossiella equi]MBP2479618.1 mannan endo-1,4-beta-mannosidase [Crossiella equi]